MTGGVTSTDVSKTFTEEETAEAEKATDLYTKSRITAEKTAFEFIKELPGSCNLNYCSFKVFFYYVILL